MKFDEINKVFTEHVNVYLNMGYTINAGTMGGSQGEIAKVDLTDGKEIVRVFVERFNSHKFNGLRGVQVVAGRCNDERVRANENNDWTIWNSKLVIDWKRRFYIVGGDCISGEWYGDAKQAQEAQTKKYERWKSRSTEEKREITLKGMALDKIKARIKRENKLQRVVVSDIKAGKDKRGYFYSYHGKTVYLR